MSQLSTHQSIELMQRQQLINDEEQELQEDVFQTDIHFYEYYINKIYNDDACRCTQYLLKYPRSNQVYRIVYNMLGFYSYETRLNRSVQIIHRILVFYSFYLFDYLIKKKSVLIHWLLLIQAIICFPLVLFAWLTRFKAICYFYWNDKCRLKHDHQLQRIIEVPYIQNGWSNKFYMMTIQEIRRFQNQLDLSDQRLSDLIIQSIEITGQAQNFKFMLITPNLMKEIKNMFLSFKKCCSAINVFLPLVLLYESAIMYAVIVNDEFRVI